MPPPLLLLVAGDTSAYWQQQVAYQITAALDEPSGVLTGRVRIGYVNRSPDTLRDFYVHQYLNAFRPGSRWSAADSAEGRGGVQHLRGPHYAFEGITRAAGMGQGEAPDYPHAPGSTVAPRPPPPPPQPRDRLSTRLLRPTSPHPHDPGEWGRGEVGVWGGGGGAQMRPLLRRAGASLRVLAQPAVRVRAGPLRRRSRAGAVPPRRQRYVGARGRAGPDDHRARLARLAVRQVRLAAGELRPSHRARRDGVSDDGDGWERRPGARPARGGTQLHDGDAREQRVARSVPGRRVHGVPDRLVLRDARRRVGVSRSRGAGVVSRPRALE